MYGAWTIGQELMQGHRIGARTAVGARDAGGWGGLEDAVS